MKDELGRQIIKKFAGTRVKTYNYLKGNNDKDKKAKGTKNVCHKKKLNLKIIKNVQNYPKLKIK